MPDTDRYGNPIKKITIEEVMDDLQQCSKEELQLLASILVVEHQQDWAEFRELLLNDLKKGISNASKV